MQLDKFHVAVLDALYKRLVPDNSSFNKPQSEGSGELTKDAFGHPKSSPGKIMTPPLEKVEMAQLPVSPTAESIWTALRGAQGFGLAVGRQSQPTNYNPFAAASGYTHGYFWIPKKNPQQIDIQDLNAYGWTPGGLLNVLADVSPEIAKALNNKLRMVGTKVTFKAVKKDGSEDPRGQGMIDDCITRINPFYGGINMIIKQLVFSIFCWGAACHDSEIMPDLKGTGNIFPVCPDTIYFERDANQFPRPFQLQYLWGMNLPELYHDMHQMNTLPFREMNLASFAYTPFDPGIDDPYGRSPAWPALQVIFFAAQLFRDLQRVVENQAWGHTDFSLKSEILMKLMAQISPNEMNSAAKLASFINDRISEVQSQYGALQPRDAFVHPDYLEVTQDVKGADLTGIDKIISAVKREIVTALKEIPQFMDVEDTGNSELTANQFEMYVHDVEAYRDVISDHIKKHLVLNAFLLGYHDLRVVSSWDAIRSTQRLQDAQAHRVEIGNHQMIRDNGWQTQDQASLKVTGTKAAKAQPDWEHLVSQKQGGTGEVASGRDKNTSQVTSGKGSTKSKNARDFNSDAQQSWPLFPMDLGNDCNYKDCKKKISNGDYCMQHAELLGMEGPDHESS